MCRKDKALALGLRVCVCICMRVLFVIVCVCVVCGHVYMQAAYCCAGPLRCECVYSAAQGKIHRVAYDRLTLL